MQTEIFTKPTKANAIRSLLMNAGYDGVDMSELNAISYRYGAIIHRLRQKGHVILTLPINRKTGHFKYVWVK